VTPTVQAAMAKAASDNRNVASRSMEGCQGTETLPTPTGAFAAAPRNWWHLPS
jgi:hypothetical protein